MEWKSLVRAKEGRKKSERLRIGRKDVRESMYAAENTEGLSLSVISVTFACSLFYR